MSDDNPILILSVDRIDGHAVVVGFSDGTSATYSQEELLQLRPIREDPGDSNGSGGSLEREPGGGED